MNCPVCGKEMKAGKIAYAPQAGIHFLPPGVQHLPRVVTKRGIEKQGGIVLDGPNNLGLWKVTERSRLIFAESAGKLWWNIKGSGSWVLVS